MKSRLMIKVLSVIMAMMMSVLFHAHGHAAFKYIFTKVADTGTTMPGLSDKFAYFDPPSISEGEVAFRGVRGIPPAPPFTGIYIFSNGTLRKVVDSNTPGFGVFMGVIYSPSISEGEVAFHFSDMPTDSWSYISNGTLSKVVDLNTPIPGGSGNFEWTANPSISDGEVTFCGGGMFGSGIYKKDSSGILSKVVDTNTPIPGGSGNFENLFFPPSISGGEVAFFGGAFYSYPPQQGIYVDRNGALHKVADLNTPIPGGTGNFWEFGGYGLPLSISGGEVAFIGKGEMVAEEGIYVGNGTLRKVADLNTPLPGVSSSFGYFGPPSISGGNVAFLRSTGSPEEENRGIYAEIDGIIDVIIDRNFMLDGKTITGFGFNQYGFDNKEIAFLVEFSDGSRGIYKGSPVPYYKVAIDIKPGNYPNSINLKSKGVIPVSILTTLNFDASTVDPSTVRFANASPAKWTIEDVDHDGDIDMLLHFKTQELGLDANSFKVSLTGMTYDGGTLMGTDSVRIVVPGPPPTCMQPPDGLTGWWPGDGNTDDIIGGRSAVLKGDATTGPGFVGEAFLLDGDGDFVNVEHHEALNIGYSDFTVALWVFFNDTAGEQVLAEKYIQGGEQGPSKGWTLTKLENNVLGFGIFSEEEGGAAIDTPDPIPIAPFTWYHFAATRRGATLITYVNGQPVAIAEDSPLVNADSNSSLKFGHRGHPDDTPGSEDDRGFYLNGGIDEAQIFVGRALSPDRISAIFTAGRTGMCKEQ
jgi:hypothetical protein